jgi:general secretion pathway protein G
MRNLRTERRGFSLIELLIVVAIIAALVGVAVPFFQDNLSEAQRTKAGQDLEVIKKAISLYDARESRPLVGTDLSPLLGRYMQELPKDPWGNDYLFDGAAGFLASYGADALPDGSGGDTDITVFTRPPLMINRVQYQGSWGRPRFIDTTVVPIKWATGNKFIISLTKPADETAAGEVADEVLLLRDTNQADGGPAPINDVTAITGWAGGAFASAKTAGDPIHRPELGVLVCYMTVDQSTNTAAQSITPTMALDFADSTYGDASNFGSDGVDVGAEVSLSESVYTGAQPAGPLDTDVFGAAVGNPLAGGGGLYRRPPQPNEAVNGLRRGIKIEKY